MTDETIVEAAVDHLIDFVELATSKPVSVNPSSIDAVLWNTDDSTDIHLKSGLGFIVIGAQSDIRAAINEAVAATRSKRRLR